MLFVSRCVPFYGPDSASAVWAEILTTDLFLTPINKPRTGSLPEGSANVTSWSRKVKGVNIFKNLSFHLQRK